MNPEPFTDDRSLHGDETQGERTVDARASTGSRAQPIGAEIVARAKTFGAEIVAQAKVLGADLAGIARVDDLRRSPSHRISEDLPEYEGEGSKPVEGRKRGVVQWPEGARSAIVIAVPHPSDRPELDWWVGGASAGNSAGNELLTSVLDRLADWLEGETDVRCFRLPYNVELGGIYMKDAAMLAGLGCIGMNNLLITPQFGPRHRLRVMLTDSVLQPTGPIDFDPCADCPMPCRKACPQKAFAEVVYTPEQYGIEALPGRTGVFSRLRCNEQMCLDSAAGETIAPEGQNKPAQRVSYCRRCELACPVGVRSRRARGPSV
ncbi:MAG TPA: epoxyqueuosine reductase [Thermoleophilia bacterium]|nr:epoxyqueuosine reductase [Thermoleophilia bacterium]